MLNILALIRRMFVRLRRSLVCLMILPCLSIPDFALDEFKALRSWIWDLHSSDWGERAMACHVLGAQGKCARAAVPALIAALHDEQWLVRRAAVDALGEIGMPIDILVPVLLPLADDKVSEVRSSAEAVLLKLLAKWRSQPKS